MRMGKRGLALTLALLLWCLAPAGVLDLRVSAGAMDFTDFWVANSDGTQTDYIANYNSVGTVTIHFTYTENMPTGIRARETYTYDIPGGLGVNQGGSGNGVWTVNSSGSNKTKLTLTVASDYDGTGDATIYATLYHVRYTRSGNIRDLTITTGTNVEQGSATQYSPELSMTIPSEFFSRSSGGSSGGGDSSGDSYSSSIIPENVIITDSSGKRLTEIDEDTPPFNLAILYADYGLLEVDVDNLGSEALEVYLTSNSSFVPARGLKGTLRALTSSSSEAPRFRADFEQVSYRGGSNSVTFQPIYDIYGDIVRGEATVTVTQVKTEEEEEEDEEIDPPTPYIIVNRYSYGDAGAQIVAGSEFQLNFSFLNTSTDIDLENIVMTVTTSEELAIASASNSYYLPNLGAGASMPYTIDLMAKNNAQVGSTELTIEFSYQYVANGARKENTTTEKVAIPISQVDRFEVDPLTEIPSATVGQESYITISFANLGKSTIYNISASATGNLEIIAPVVRYSGNLEASKSDTMDVSVIPQTPGDLYGEIVIQYEDENTNTKTVSIPFSMYVEDVYIPSYDPPPDEGMLEDDLPKTPMLNIVITATGGLLLAAAIAIYLIRRIRVKGSEELDEDF